MSGATFCKVVTTDISRFENTAFAEYSIIAHNGPQNATNYLLNGKNTKPDLSAGQHQLWEIESGKKYLFRMVNSAAQNMWKLHIDHHKMTVIGEQPFPHLPIPFTRRLLMLLQPLTTPLSSHTQPIGSQSVSVNDTTSSLKPTSQRRLTTSVQ